MSSRPYVCLALALLFAGCSASPEEKKKKEAEKKPQPLAKQTEDPTFLAFLSRLRTAVANKDQPAMTAMMTSDFGYRWDNPPVGDNVFTYWDMNETWPVLNKMLREKFVPHGDYMVAPAAVATDASYHGFRAGMRMINGSWRFAYFVPGEGTIRE